jgi:hypothetical protein
MPLPRELPESLQLLPRRQALEISDVHFIRDVGDLIEALKRPAGTRTFHSPKWIKPALATAISIICALAAGIGIWTWQRPVVPRNSVPQTNAPSLANPPKITDNANISGNWRAVVQKKDVKYEIYFTFEVVDDKLFGTAIYPTGEAGIVNGTVGQDKISFITKHVPDFADEEATITVEGRVSSDEIQVFTQDKDGYSKGVAHRVARISKAKVLAP